MPPATPSKQQCPSPVPAGPQEMSRHQLDGLLENVQLEINDRVQKLRQRSQLLTAALRLRLDLELGRFPKEVRAMTVREFSTRYRGNISNFYQQDHPPADPGSHKTPHRSAATNNRDPVERLLHQTFHRTIQKSTPSSTPRTNKAALLRQALTAAKSVATGVAVTETPLRFNPLLPSTPGYANLTRTESIAARMPGRHESIMSVNGSPLVNVYHANQPPQPPAQDSTNPSRTHTRVRASSVIAVPLEDAENSHEGKAILIELDHSDPEQQARHLQQLDHSAKEQVRSHLEKLQLQLQSLMGHVNP